MRFASLGLACVALILTGSLIRGEEKPAAKPGVSGVTIGEMRVQVVPPLTYLYDEAETSFARMGEPVRASFDKVFSAAVEAKMIVVRPTMLVYAGNPHFDLQKDFKMEIGVVVEPETPAPAGLKVRKTAEFKCVTILYTGPVDRQGEAYQKLIPALKAAGHTPTGEEREMCLYWEGLDSSNNVFQMQIGIK